MVREATVRWRRCYDRIGACDGIELLGVLATARERFRRDPAAAATMVRSA
jgi:hypothetical protein